MRRVAKTIRVGSDVDLDEFYDAACRASIIESKVEHDSSKGELSIDKPEKFKYEDWPEWEKSVYTYMYCIKNSIGTPLVYVIRKPIFIHDLEPHYYQLIINNAPHVDAVFCNDYQQVLTLLTYNWNRH